MVLKHAHNPCIIFTCFGRGSSPIKILPGSILLEQMFRCCSPWARISWRNGGHLARSTRWHICSQVAEGAGSAFAQQCEFTVFGDHGRTVSIKQDCKRSHWGFNADEALFCKLSLSADITMILGTTSFIFPVLDELPFRWIRITFLY